MSDPTTNREIEDVLSSIRRLVSQERVVDKPADPAQARGEGALMLTPAFRVIEGHGGRPADIAITADSEDGIAFHSGRIRGDTMLATLGSVGRLGRGDRAGDAPEDPRARPDTLADAAPDAIPGAQAAPDEDADDEFAVDTWGDDPADTTLEATIAELEAAVAGIDTEFEPDGGEDPGEEEAGADAVWFDVADGAPAVAAPAPVSAAPASDDAADSAAPPTTEAGSDWSSDLPGDELGEGAEWDFGLPAAASVATDGEAASGAIGSRRLHLASDAGDVVIAPAARMDDPGRAGIADPHPAEDQPEPVRSRIFVRRSASPDDEVDTGAPDAPAPDRDAPGVLAAQAGPDEIAGDDDEYDDAADLADLDLGLLRQIVSDMIRQELRGPLGERITQNVRKLVRREVMRALESREFE